MCPLFAGDSLRKSCIKRRNSAISFRRKSSGASIRRRGSACSKNSRSFSIHEETSNSSLRHMMLQEESEFQLFRRKQTALDKERRAANRERMMQLLSMSSRSTDPESIARERMKRRASEPDLMRCSVRIIPDAPILSWEEYRRKRTDYMRSMFFRSVGNLLGRKNSSGKSARRWAMSSSDGVDAVDLLQFHGRSHPPIRARSPVSRKSSLIVPSFDYYQMLNNKLNLRLQQLDSKQQVQQQQQPRTSPPISRRSSSTLSNGRHSCKETKRSSMSQPSPRRPTIHEDCCECSYQPLSQTVTIVKMPVEAGRGGQSQWRACLVSGRDSLSCSLNSP